MVPRLRFCHAYPLIDKKCRNKVIPDMSRSAPPTSMALSLTPLCPPFSPFFHLPRPASVCQILPSLPFRSLQELNLDKNLLANFVALGGLPSLGVLRLSYNRIETVRCGRLFTVIGCR